MYTCTHLFGIWDFWYFQRQVAKWDKHIIILLGMVSKEMLVAIFKFVLDSSSNSVVA